MFWFVYCTIFTLCLWTTSWTVSSRPFVLQIVRRLQCKLTSLLSKHVFINFSVLEFQLYMVIDQCFLFAPTDVSAKPGQCVYATSVVWHTPESFGEVSARKLQQWPVLFKFFKTSWRSSFGCTDHYDFQKQISRALVLAVLENEERRSCETNHQGLAFWKKVRLSFRN